MSTVRKLYETISDNGTLRVADNGELVFLSPQINRFFKITGYTTDFKRKFEDYLETPMDKVLTSDELAYQFESVNPRVRSQLTITYAIVNQIMEKSVKRALQTPACCETLDLMVKLVKEAKNLELISSPNLKIFGVCYDKKFSYNEGSRIREETMSDLPLVTARLRII